MNCIICRQADFKNGITSISFERDEFRLQIKNVPALVCPSCGEAIVSEEAALQLLRLAEDASISGIREGVLEYVSPS